MDARSTLTKPAHKGAAAVAVAEAQVAAAVAGPVVVVDAAEPVAADPVRGENPAGKRRKERPAW